MKNLILFFVLAILSWSLQAQEEEFNPTSEGNWMIELNTGSWATGNTSFSLMSIDDMTIWSVGIDAGYFVSDNFVIKGGLGYSDADIVDGTFVYKVGAKYYLGGEFPMGIDFTGVSSDGDSANWLGAQAGYAWFVAKQISVEPTLRYNFTLDEEEADSAFQALMGFTFYF